MKRKIITIADNGTVTIPNDVRMSINEIAKLFGIYYPTAKKCVRAIEKSGVAGGDYSMCCTVEGMTVYPEYYGLEMVVAVAFRVQSEKAKVFRNWLMKKVTASQIVVQFSNSIQPADMRNLN